MQAVSAKAFRAVRKTRLSEGIIEQVRDLIASGRLKPGDRLPAERELAQTFRVGRSAVREAIRAMESLGLVEVRPGEGTFLTAPQRGQGRDPLTASLYQAWSTQRKLFEVRRVLEPALAALAARRATAEQIAKLHATLEEQGAEIQKGGTGVKEDTSFHYLLAEASGNEILLRIVDSLMHLVQKTREESLQQGGRPARSLKQHQAILKAIEVRDPAAAERRMRQHILAVERLAFSTHGQPPAEPGTDPASLAAGVGR